MLVPQNHRYVCQRCGRSQVCLTALCPFCGSRLALPWPTQRYAATPFPPVVPAPQSNYTPLVVELLLNFLGIYGVGWLMIGNVGVGISLLICSIVLWPLVLLFTLFTLGLVLLCLGPLGIGAIVCNVLLLQRAMKNWQRDGAACPRPGMPVAPGRETDGWTFIDHHPW
ncbi:MAG TPA: hypothetical protein VFV38_39835 [Ktedonobacteraceae bacterium]|nr:hypothetical protein [Ktedonobacteraceae bacterium]